MLGTILFLGLLVGSQARPDRSSGSLAQHNCPSSGHLLLPHEYDNTKFYFCEWGSRREPPSTCASGTVFSFRSQSCDWPWNVESEIDSFEEDHENDAVDHEVESDSDAVDKDSEGSNNDAGNIDDLDDVDGGELYDKNDVETDNDEVLPNGCPANFTIYRLLPHEYNCRKFYYCVAGKAISKRCSPGLYFNPDVSACDWPQNVDCESIGDDDDEETNDSNNEETEGSDDDDVNNDESDSDDEYEGESLENGCPANFTVHRLLPHESNCSEFYFCVFGETVLRTCPPGLYFNPNVSNCDWRWNVDCETDSTDNEDNDDEEDSGVGDDEGNIDNESDDEGTDEGNNGDGDENESDSGGNDNGNETEVDDGANNRPATKKKLEILAVVKVKLKKRNQLKKIYYRREHKIIRRSPTLAKPEVN